MTVEVRGIGLDMTDALRSHTRNRVHFALGRFAERIRRVTVRFVTTNGRHTCRAVVDTRRGGRLVVEDSDRDGYVAANRSLGRLGRTVARSIERLRVPG